MAGQPCCYGFTLRTACITIGVVFALFDLYLLAIGCSWFIVTFGIIANGLLIFGAAKKKRWYLMPSIVLHALANIGEMLMLVAVLYGSVVVHAAISEASVKDLPPYFSDQMALKGIDISTFKEYVNIALAVYVFCVVLFTLMHTLITTIFIGHFNELHREEQHEEHLDRLVSDSHSFYPNLPAALSIKVP